MGWVEGCVGVGAVATGPVGVFDGCCGVAAGVSAGGVLAVISGNVVPEFASPQATANRQPIQITGARRIAVEIMSLLPCVASVVFLIG